MKRQWKLPGEPTWPWPCCHQPQPRLSCSVDSRDLGRALRRMASLAPFLGNRALGTWTHWTEGMAGGMEGPRSLDGPGRWRTLACKGTQTQARPLLKEVRCAPRSVGTAEAPQRQKLAASRAQVQVHRLATSCRARSPGQPTGPRQSMRTLRGSGASCSSACSETRTARGDRGWMALRIRLLTGGRREEQRACQ